MRVVYSFKLEAICPVDGLADLYSVEVISDVVIPVENLLDALETVSKNDFQENITQELSRILPAEVKTVGWHSGVKTECIC
jgi:hypothetical protein